MSLQIKVVNAKGESLFDQKVNEAMTVAKFKKVLQTAIHSKSKHPTHSLTLQRASPSASSAFALPSAIARAPCWPTKRNHYLTTSKIRQ